MKLKWTHYLGLLVAAFIIGWFFQNIRIYIGIILAIILLNVAWQILFCRGEKMADGSVTFNLSSTAEWVNILVMSAISLTTLYYLFTEQPVWYEWILPCMYSLLFIGRIFEIKSNMRDSITINGNSLSWSNSGTNHQCQMASYKFDFEKSEAMNSNLIGANLGWHLKIKDTQGENHSLDLKTMNLNGHKKAIEKAFQQGATT